MAKYNVHAGHCPQGKGASGAVGFLKESVEDRIVKDEMIRLLRAEGHTANDCTCDVATTQSGCLARIVTKCNSHEADEDASVHLNSGRKDKKGDGDTGGVEVLIYSWASASKETAERICEEVSKELEIRNRGVKVDSSLYVLRKTKAPAYLVECCFVDDKDDYEKWDAKRCAKAIVRGMLDKDIKVDSGSSGSTSSGSTSSSSGNSVNYKVKINTSSGVNMRKGAGTGYGIITAIPNKTTVTITKKSGSWGYTSYGGKKGWICLDYTKKATSGSSAPTYKVGSTYTLQADALRVRTGAGTNYTAKTYSQLTSNAQKHAYSNGCLKKGTEVTCKQIKNVGDDIWMKIPSGWIAAYYNKKTYVK